tara:strand:- start:1714 stop:1962 length:249 start_codon:yes stop_codon:yes gene_type:complete
MSSVKRWKKKTYMSVDVLLEDEFYAKTPDLDKTFPPSNKAKWTVIEQKDTRSTLEELPIEEEKNEETPKENPSMDKPTPPEV